MIQRRERRRKKQQFSTNSLLNLYSAVLNKTTKRNRKMLQNIFQTLTRSTVIDVGEAISMKNKKVKFFPNYDEPTVRFIRLINESKTETLLYD
jgi:hypothetical protein